MRIATIQDRINARASFGLLFDAKYKYCLNSEVLDNDLDLYIAFRDSKFCLKYQDGCFYPYLYVKET